MAGLEIVPFNDAHLDDAAALLAARHERHREAEPLLPGDVDFRAEIEQEWRPEGASGVFAGDAYLIGAPSASSPRISWMRVEIAGQAIEGDREAMRDLYAAAAQRGSTRATRSTRSSCPRYDARARRCLVPARLRWLGDAGDARNTARRSRSTAGVEIRSRHARRLRARRRGWSVEMSSAMQPVAELLRKSRCRASRRSQAEWREDEDADEFELFVAERDGRIVGQYPALPPAARPARAGGRASTSRRPRPSPRRAAPASGAR